jgi:hypothetical protein
MHTSCPCLIRYSEQYFLLTFYESIHWKFHVSLQIPNLCGDNILLSHESGLKIWLLIFSIVSSDWNIFEIKLFSLFLNQRIFVLNMMKRKKRMFL